MSVYLPLGQGTQTVLPVTFWKRPVGQKPHSVMPSIGATKPGRQGRHVLLLVALTVWLCVPAGQGTHVDLLEAPRAPL